MLEQICDWIILISAVLIAIVNICNFFGKPVNFFKRKHDAEEKERVIEILRAELPEMLKSHDLETRDRYKSDRQRYLEEIRDEVVEIIKEPMLEQNSVIDVLTRSSKDVLREKIMGLYHKGKEKRCLECYEREALNQYYIDYKAMHGNSYIDKYYKRMKKWAVLPDDIEDIEDERDDSDCGQHEHSSKHDSDN